LARAGQAAMTSYTRKLYQRGLQTLSWKAEDPNNDTLLYDLYYRRVGSEPLRVRVVARDEGGVLRRAEFSADGQRWQEVHPQDGINDSPEEAYEIVPGAQTSPGPHLLVVRVFDLLGNVGSAQVEFP